jgi:hypothetical protein
MRLGPLLAHLRALEIEVALQLRAAAERHRDEHDIYHQCHTFAVTAEERATKANPFSRRYDGVAEWTSAVAEGSEVALEELRILYLRLQEVAITWTMVVQAAQAARDPELLTVATECQSEAEMQAKWFTTRIKTAAPQMLVVAG